MSIWLFLLLMAGLLIAAILILFWHPQRVRIKTNAPVSSQRTDAHFRDDERNWYSGVFYFNRDDPALFVPKRYGFGWTMNFGHPQAKLVLLALFLLTVVPPIIVAIIGTLYPGSIHPHGCHPSGCY